MGGGMTEAFLVLQSAVRSRLTAASAVTALVPATSILDLNQRPSVMPAVLIGEGQTIPDEGLRRDRHEITFDLHVWAMEPGTAVVKSIVGAIRDALADTLWPISGLEVADLYIQSAHYMRDPDTVHSHAVVTLRCRVRVLA
jgi:hypothetical protein